LVLKLQGLAQLVNHLVRERSMELVALIGLAVQKVNLLEPVALVAQNLLVLQLVNHSV
jgi:hypothetical protein